MIDTHEWTFHGGSGIVTTTTGGTREAPDFCVAGAESIRQELAAEVLRLANEQERIRLELVQIIKDWTKSAKDVRERARGLEGAERYAQEARATTALGCVNRLRARLDSIYSNSGS